MSVLSSLPTPRIGSRDPRRLQVPAAPKPRWKDWVWAIAGLGACMFAVARLYDEATNITARDVGESLRSISTSRWICAVLSSALAYFALALYDRVALLHLGRKGIPFAYVAATSFATYAISHNVGASVISGAVVRYRAYTGVGLSPADVAVLVAVTASTFGLGCCLVGGVLLVWSPSLLSRLSGLLPGAVTTPAAAAVFGRLLVGVVVAYMLGSILRCRPVTTGSAVEYPRPQVVLRQLAVAPLELFGAAGIIHFALPPSEHPGFATVLGVFIASFAGALASHAPGGVGVFELLFVRAMPEVPRAAVIAALFVWRLLFLLLPLVVSVPLVLSYERRRSQGESVRMAMPWTHSDDRGCSPTLPPRTTPDEV
eukprot:TRINITY_DN4445_c2_g1_i2.p1 TRINITY_DN4445_c2_g1~~TRINITY_DN4445_c2_g1_i2.p1  ORF type:complete len:389 (+),score=59.06 TRINITY_DN4445_c2_g1_i2:58-1167(+)